MPHLILEGGTANAISHTLTAYERLAVEAVSADVDTAAASGSTSVDVIFTDQAGLLISRSRSAADLATGAKYEITFAPYLPDSFDLGTSTGSLIVTTGLAQTILPPQATITVQAVDAGALVTQVRIWAENVEDTQTQIGAETATFGRWAYVPGPGA